MRSKEIAGWLRHRVTAAGAEGLVVELSGSLDSAVVARLCQLAMPERTLAVMLPAHPDTVSEDGARLVAEHFTLRVVRISLDAGRTQLSADLQAALSQLSARDPAPAGEIRARHALANVNPRVGMAAAYFIADSLNYLVAGAANRSDLTIGSFTKHGDGAADLLPLGNALASEVLALARDLDVPAALTANPRSAPSSEHEMGFTDADLERYLEDGPEAVAPAVALKIERLMRASDLKRALPQMPGEG